MQMHWDTASFHLSGGQAHMGVDYAHEHLLGPSPPMNCWKTTHNSTSKFLKMYALSDSEICLLWFYPKKLSEGYTQWACKSTHRATHPAENWKQVHQFETHFAGFQHCGPSMWWNRHPVSLREIPWPLGWSWRELQGAGLLLCLTPDHCYVLGYPFYNYSILLPTCVLCIFFVLCMLYFEIRKWKYVGRFFNYKGVHCIWLF
jgi:hypothetical protein